MTYDPLQPELPARSGRYDCGAAAFHLFAHVKREGWRPLLIFGAIYVGVYLLSMVLMFSGIWSFVTTLDSEAYRKVPDAYPMGMMLARMFGLVGVAIILNLVMWVVVEAGLLRWLLGRPGLVRFGGDELRLIVVMILWSLMSLVVLGIPSVALGVGIGLENVGLGLLGGLSLLVALVGLIPLSVRFAPAGALTVHDRAVRFFSAWGVSKGRFWPVLGAFVIAWLVYMGASIVVQTVMQIVGVMALGSAAGAFMSMDPNVEPSTDEILTLFTSTGFIIFMLIFMAFSCVIAFLFQAVMAGVNVYNLLNPEAGRGVTPMASVPPVAPAAPAAPVTSTAPAADPSPTGAGA